MTLIPSRIESLAPGEPERVHNEASSIPAKDWPPPHTRARQIVVDLWCGMCRLADAAVELRCGASEAYSNFCHADDSLSSWESKEFSGEPAFCTERGAAATTLI